MKTLKKILKRIGITLLILIVVFIVGLVVFLNYKAVLARHKIAGIEDYASSVTEINIPDSARIVALGEASHGNIEFQELKLTVLQNLVQNYGYCAFGLELDFGESLAINDYIQGGEGVVQDLVSQMSFPIYHTEQIVELVEWMRSYNESASAESKIRFYGFDMQNTQASADYLIKFCKDRSISGIDDVLDTLTPLTDVGAEMDEESAFALKQNLEIIAATLEKYKAEELDLQYESALQATNTLHQAMASFEVHGEKYYDYRDGCMAQNVSWILNLEDAIGSGKIMIAAHNGHVTKSWSDNTMTMGRYLEQEYKDAYYGIGTDFFTADININTSSMVDDKPSRGNHHFCSADPLAYQARSMPDKMYYLDFSKVTEESSDLYKQIHTDTPMANIGEGYMWVWYLFPDSVYRPAQTPVDMYDSMIYVYKAHPISVFE